MNKLSPSLLSARIFIDFLENQKFDSKNYDREKTTEKLENDLSYFFQTLDFTQHQFVDSLNSLLKDHDHPHPVWVGLLHQVAPLLKAAQQYPLNEHWKQTQLKHYFSTLKPQYHQANPVEWPFLLWLQENQLDPRQIWTEWGAKISVLDKEHTLKASAVPVALNYRAFHLLKALLTHPQCLERQILNTHVFVSIQRGSYHCSDVFSKPLFERYINDKEAYGLLAQYLATSDDVQQSLFGIRKSEQLKWWAQSHSLDLKDENHKHFQEHLIEKLSPQSNCSPLLSVFHFEVEQQRLDINKTETALALLGRGNMTTLLKPDSFENIQWGHYLNQSEPAQIKKAIETLRKTFEKQTDSSWIYDWHQFFETLNFLPPGSLEADESFQPASDLFNALFMESRRGRVPKYAWKNLKRLFKQHDIDWQSILVSAIERWERYSFKQRFQLFDVNLLWESFEQHSNDKNPFDFGKRSQQIYDQLSPKAVHLLCQTSLNQMMTHLQNNHKSKSPVNLFSYSQKALMGDFCRFLQYKKAQLLEQKDGAVLAMTALGWEMASSLPNENSLKHSLQEAETFFQTVLAQQELNEWKDDEILYFHSTLKQVGLAAASQPLYEAHKTKNQLHQQLPHSEEDLKTRRLRL